jgi:hypothetical protein
MGYNSTYVGNLPWDIIADDMKSSFLIVKFLSIQSGTDKETDDSQGRFGILSIV